ncbi:MAG: TetR family transcriptional regulator [Nocardioides sp.]
MARHPIDSAAMRQRILVVAARLFAEHGYSGTSVRDIAEQLGIANPSLYYHFQNKAALLDELLRAPLDVVQQAAVRAAGLETHERLRVLIEGMLEALEVHSGVALAALERRGAAGEVSQALAEAAAPDVTELLVEAGDATDAAYRLRVTMALAAVEAAVRSLMVDLADDADFVRRLRTRRAEIVDAALRLLDPRAP